MAECEAKSTHSVVYDNEVGAINFEWLVDNPEAYIVSGQGTSTVEIGSTSENFVQFNLTCKITDDNGNSIYTEAFIHQRESTSPTNEDTFYIMDEPLVTPNTTKDFVVSDPVNNGIFSWNPTTVEYPEDGTAILAGTNTLEFSHDFPADKEWFHVRTYDIDKANFKMMVIIYHGDGRASFAYGDQSNFPVLLDENINLSYTPMAGNYIMSDVLDIPIQEITYDMAEFIGDLEITYKMDEFTDTQGY